MSRVASLRRRLKRVPVHPSIVASALREGTIYKVKKGVPEDAKLIRQYDDAKRGCVYLIFQHPSFEPVPEGEVIPELYVKFESNRAKPPQV